jgi:hypothetical protein
MKVSDIIQTKGSLVKTVRPEASALELAVRLHSVQIGAMVAMFASGTSGHSSKFPFCRLLPAADIAHNQTS